MASPTTLFSLLLLFCCRSCSTSTNLFSAAAIPYAEPPLAPSPQPPPEIIGLIREACKASNDTSTCESTLSEWDHQFHNATLMNIIQSALSLSSQNQNIAISMVNDLIEFAGKHNEKNLTIAANNCLVGLIYGNYRTDLTFDALPRGRMKDARAWISAASGYHVGCAAGFKNVKGTSKVNETVAFLQKLVILSNNALSIMVNYDNFGEETSLWGPPKTERGGFWEPVEVPGDGSLPVFGGGVPSGENADATVCKGGRCNYEKVQDAVDAAPVNNAGRRFVIWIKEGIYEEIVRVPLEKKNVVLVGDGMGKTVITGSRNVGIPGITTFDSATVGVAGDGFMARDLTIQNTAGSIAQQAVAFRSSSDHSILENCEFIANQDTLYPHSLRQFYKSCRIQGNVDFIFGNAAAIFQDCIILVASRTNDPEKGAINAVTAHGRNLPAQSTGFVFQNCTINGTEEYISYYHKNPKVHKTYLGRPWKEYSRTVYINCTLAELVSPEGWLPWSGNFALDTLYYGELENKGPGATTTGRVDWSSKVPAEHVNTYSVQNFIQGERKLFVSGSTSTSNSDSFFNGGIWLSILLLGIQN